MIGFDFKILLSNCSLFRKWQLMSIYCPCEWQLDNLLDLVPLFLHIFVGLQWTKLCCMWKNMFYFSFLFCFTFQFFLNFSFISLLYWVEFHYSIAKSSEDKKLVWYLRKYLIIKYDANSAFLFLLSDLYQIEEFPFIPILLRLFI